MNQRTPFIIGGIALVLCCLCVIVIGIVAALGGGLAAIGLSQSPSGKGDAFMTALRDGDYSKAYSLCTTDLQQELGSAQGLKTLIESNDVKPTKWNFTSSNVSGDTAELEGNVTFTSDRAGTVNLVLTREGNDWKIAGFHLSET